MTKKTMDNYYSEHQFEDQEPEIQTTNEQLVLKTAVAAIYFDDSSTFEHALWQIVELIGGRELVDLLDTDSSSAYQKYVVPFI